MSYDLIMARLVWMGYPKGILELKYNPDFPIRGLIFDKDTGNLLKLDEFGNIIYGVHGHAKISKQDLSQLYPSLFIPSEDLSTKFYPMYTMYNSPECAVYGDLIDYLEKSQNSNTEIQLRDSNNKDEFGVLSYSNLFQDVRSAMDYVHLQGQLKEETIKNLSQYLDKDPKIATCFSRLRKNGFKLFLLTNSEWSYTNAVMKYLLNDQLAEYENWTDYFDIKIVHARKPIFFQNGTPLREIDPETGNLSFQKTTTFEKGKIYQGGNLSLLEKGIDATGNQILYVGDHLYTDVIKSKKKNAWRTFFIIPELEKEIRVWRDSQDKFRELQKLNLLKAKAFEKMDAHTTKEPTDLTAIRRAMKETSQGLDSRYNLLFGSVFRSGTKETLFANQVRRYSDLYSYTYLNLLNYPLFYHFTADAKLLPHETTQNLFE